MKEKDFFRRVSNNMTCEIAGYHFILLSKETHTWVCKETGDQFVSALTLPVGSINVSPVKRSKEYEFHLFPASRKPVCMSLFGTGWPKAEAVITNNFIDWNNISKMEMTVSEKLDSTAAIKESDTELHLYADGLLEAIPAGVLAVAKYCEKNKIPLTVWHYDNKRKNHWPQRMY